VKSKINQWINQLPKFQELPDTDKIVRLAFFHTVEERRGTVSRLEIEILFDFIDVRVPTNLRRLLAHLSRPDGPLIKKADGEYSVARSAQNEIRGELAVPVRAVAAAAHAPVAAFEFPDKNFRDAKVRVLVAECKQCYGQGCWNACGILMRIILERTLDSLNAQVKALRGLHDKLNFCIANNPGGFAKTAIEGLKELKGAKLIGDIVAHHSNITLDRHDIDVVVIPFRLLLKEATTI